MEEVLEALHTASSPSKNSRSYVPIQLKVSAQVFDTRIRLVANPSDPNISL